MNSKKLTDAAKLKAVLDDPILWMRNFVRIVDKKGELIPFELNAQQLQFMNEKEKMNIILKSRQLGFSTLTCGLALYHACTKPNTHCLLVSYSQESASSLFDKLKQMYETIPTPVKPALNTNNKKELSMKNGSKVTCATAGLKEIARGMTLTFVHLSEFAFWRENAGDLLLGLEQALTPNSTLVIESTANGMNFFSELYRAAAAKVNTYKPFFFSWWEDKVMFNEEYELYYKIFMAQNNNKLPLWCDYEKELLLKGAREEQLIWRRIKISNMGYDGEKKFKQEFPSTDIEAFQTTGYGLFDAEMISEQAMSALEPLKYEDIEKFSDRRKDSFLLDYGDRFPGELLEYVKSGELVIYELRKPQWRYYVGCDFSEGVGRDFTVFYGQNFNCFTQFCFKSNRLRPTVCADILNKLARYYNYAYLVIERASSGPTAIDKLRNEYGYMNMHKHKMMDERGKKRSQIGFVTSQKSKVQIINDLREWFNEGELVIYDKTTLNELSTFVLDEGGRMRASGSNHDDHVMAAALSLHGLKTGIWYA